MTVEREDRIRFDETDQQGVVYYGEFFTFMDEAAMALFRAHGFDVATMRAAGWTTHVVHASMDYRAPARYGDVLVSRAAVGSMGTTSLTVDYEAETRASDEPLVSGEVVYVTVDLETDDPIPVPDAFRAALTTARDDEPGTNS